MDPLAEKFDSWSPYNYGLNNPISNIDPDGMDVIHISKSNYTNFTIDWDTGINAGNYILYGGRAKDASGNPIDVWIARREGGRGYRDDWVVDPESVKEFRSNSYIYEANANVVESYESYSGSSYWDRFFEIYSIRNLASGAALFGATSLRTTGKGSRIAVGRTSNGGYKELLTPNDEFDFVTKLYRGTTGSEKSGNFLFLTDDPIVASSYIKNGGKLIEFDIPNSALYNLRARGSLEVLEDIHLYNGSSIRHQTYKFVGSDLRKALMNISK